MPIKLPKGFQRRKSSSNALEEVLNPPDSSFRVLERPASKDFSFDGGASLRAVSTGALRPLAKTHDDPDDEQLFGVGAGRNDAGNRYATSHRRGQAAQLTPPFRSGSGGTEHSRSTAPYDSASSSARLSTSSTNPSSIDTRSDKNVRAVDHGAVPDLPAPPPQTARPGFLRSPTRGFSFGVIKGSRTAPTSPSAGLPPAPGPTRGRVVSTSTTSTATPPRLFDSDLALDNAELDGFGNMFDHIGSSRDASPPAAARVPTDTGSFSSPSYPPTSFPGAGALRDSRAAAPTPINVDRTQVLDSSPYTWTSPDSHDGLMRSPSPSKTITQASPSKLRQNSIQSEYQGSLAPATLSSIRPLAPRAGLSDEHAPPPPPHGQGRLLSTSLPRSPVPDQDRGMSPRSTHSSTFDPSMAADAELANMYQATKTMPPKPTPTNKVMTPAQWERYKQQKEMDRRLGALSNASDSEPEENYDDDDDDETERDRQAVKQRRKQEAHLSVYRQTMMKVTGDPTPPRPESSLSTIKRGNGSALDLNNRLSGLTAGSSPTGPSSGDDEDEDEDVPLGILAAHGFPNRNRPPTRLAKSSSNPSLRVVTQPASVAPPSASQTPRTGALPVFARHLPQDPYYGASLVNAANRESLAFHAGGAPMGNTGPSTAHPIHPAGLVGVIAGEERARAARRGSPNASGGFDVPTMSPHPGMPRSQTMGNLAAMGYPPNGVPGMPMMMTPGDQAQIQMSQQMTQMMHMQMQWMQQMQHMMGGAYAPNPSMPPPPGPAPSQRPQSMHLQNAPMPMPGQRTMSSLNPSMAPWNVGAPGLGSATNPHGSYAPSLAPSERSNVGLASRYRPVSIAAEPEERSQRRASTFTSSTFRPWSQVEPSAPNTLQTVKPTIGFVGRRSPLGSRDDDDDDDEGWAEMKMKKDQKQKTWALRKGENPLHSLYTNAS